jgi:hypothetical protein
MMRRALQCAVFVLLASVASVVPARAEIGWWDYLEQMSGPGPFDRHGPLGPIITIDTGIACRRAEPAREGESRWIFANSTDCLLSPARTGARRVQDFFAFRFGAGSTDEIPLFQDRPQELIGEVQAWTLDIRYKRRLDAAITIAAGGGIIFFTGDTIDHHVVRTTLAPLSIEFTPIGLLHRTEPQKYDGLVGLRFEQLVVLGGLKASDFNSRSTSAYETDNADLVRRFSITIDISPFVFRQSR